MFATKPYTAASMLVGAAAPVSPGDNAGLAPMATPPTSRPCLCCRAPMRPASFAKSARRCRKKSACGGRSRAVRADKGYCGPSGATAAAGTAIWHVSADPAARAAAKASRYTLGGELAEPAWMDRVLERTCAGLEQLAEWGYPFPQDDA